MIRFLQDILRKDVGHLSSTIKDVARRAGVSIATVSKFINGGNVLEENRTAIENAIHELNYQVNTVARGMKTRRSMTVGVLIPSVADYFGISILASVNRELYKHGYSTIICGYSVETANSAQSMIEFLINKQVDGIIMQPLTLAPGDLARAESQDTPIVFVDTQFGAERYDNVLIDNREIAGRITRYLISLGHRRIGLITSAPGVQVADERVIGYREAISNAGIPFDPELMHLVSYYEEDGYAGMQHFMDLPDPPTAVFATGNDLTVGVLSYAGDKGLTIPDDISVVGFENQKIARVYRPRITIGVQPIENIGLTAAVMLIERMTGVHKGPGRTVRLQASVEYGASVKDLSGNN